jgi:hypothetical protein
MFDSSLTNSFYRQKHKFQSVKTRRAPETSKNMSVNDTELLFAAYVLSTPPHD